MALGEVILSSKVFYFSANKGWSGDLIPALPHLLRALKEGGQSNRTPPLPWFQSPACGMSRVPWVSGKLYLERVGPGEKKHKAVRHMHSSIWQHGHLEQDKGMMGTPVLVVPTRVEGEIWIRVHSSPVDQVFGKSYSWFLFPTLVSCLIGRSLNSFRMHSGSAVSYPLHYHPQPRTVPHPLKGLLLHSLQPIPIVGSVNLGCKLHDFPCCASWLVAPHLPPATIEMISAHSGAFTVTTPSPTQFLPL